MKKTIILSCFVLFATINIFASGKQDTQNDSSGEIVVQEIHRQGPDYDKIAVKLNVNVDDLIRALEKSESGASLDLKSIATNLNVTERALSDAMGPPPPKEDAQDSRPHSPGIGNIFQSLIVDYGNPQFEINSMAIENGELLDAYKCEKNVDNIENSIPLSWNNVPEKTKSLAIVMYHYPDPNDISNRNSYLLLWGIDPVVSEIPYGEADNGDWYMGQNKDGNQISYTSPCSHGPGVHEYLISIFALADVPELLPKESSLNVSFDLLMTAIESVEILGRADLEFKAITK